MCLAGKNQIISILALWDKICDFFNLQIKTKHTKLVTKLEFLLVITESYKLQCFIVWLRISAVAVVKRCMKCGHIPSRFTFWTQNFDRNHFLSIKSVVALMKNIGSFHTKRWSDLSANVAMCRLLFEANPFHLHLHNLDKIGIHQTQLSDLFWIPN